MPAAVVLWLLLSPIAAHAQIVSTPAPVSNLPDLENEPSLAMSGDLAVALWPIVRSPCRFDIGWALSTDRGLSWAQRGQFPAPPGFSYRLTAGTSVCAESGVFYAAALVCQAGPDDIAFYRGTYDGTTIDWQFLRYVLGSPFMKEDLDFPWLVCDPAQHVLYLTHTFDFGEVRFMRSLDGGLTWTVPQALSSQASNGARMVLGPSGELYVIWEDFAASSIVGRRSVDHGVTFSNQFTVAPHHDNLGLTPANWLANNDGRNNPVYRRLCNGPAFPAVAIDSSTGPSRGTLYVTWPDYGAGTISGIDRYLVEAEPNDTRGTANEIRIGDEIAGFLPSADLGPTDCDVFTLVGTAGTTIVISASMLSSEPQDILVYSLMCVPDTTRADTTQVETRLGCGGAHTSRMVPPIIYTLPADGRYYLDLGCSSLPSKYYSLRIQTLVASPEEVARDHRDIVLVSSGDGGETWSSKVRVNDEPARFDDALPEVGVDEAGRVYVAWYDTRESEGCPSAVGAYWSVSEDGAKSFRPSQPLGPPVDLSTVRYWRPGDHMSMGRSGDQLVLLWAHMTGYEDADVYRVTFRPDVQTGIAVDRLEASLDGARVRLTWHVLDRRGVAGIRLFRQGPLSANRETDIPVDHEGLYVYDDADVAHGQRFVYRLEVHSQDGRVTILGPIEVEIFGLVDEPLAVEVLPNPFGSGATVRLNALERVTIRILGIDGRLVAKLQPRPGAAGKFEAYWDGRDRYGRGVRPGVYIVHIESRVGGMKRRVVHLE